MATVPLTSRRRPLWVGGWLLFLLPLPTAFGPVLIALGKGALRHVPDQAPLRFRPVLILGAWTDPASGLYQAKRRPMSSALPLKVDRRS